MAYVNLGQVIYPVGAIFASASSISPSSMFGGTWSQITGDACLMAGTTVGATGSKTISIDQIPPHNHKIGWYNAGGGLLIDNPLTCDHQGSHHGWNGIFTYQSGGAGLSALFLQMLYVETYRVAKETYSIEVIPHA